MEAIVYEVAKKGEGVIIGHGSQMLLRDFECAALKLIKKNDHEKKGFFRYAFHMDWNNPSLYDLILNTEKTGMDLVVKTVQEVALSGQMQACSLTALEAMEKLSLKKRIHAAILKNDISLLDLNVEVPETGIVEIKGFSKNHSVKGRITSGRFG